MVRYTLTINRLNSSLDDFALFLGVTSAALFFLLSDLDIFTILWMIILKGNCRL